MLQQGRERGFVMPQRTIARRIDRPCQVIAFAPGRRAIRQETGNQFAVCLNEFQPGQVFGVLNHL